MNDKDVIIAQKQKEIQELRASIAQLRDEIAQLKKNSSNTPVIGIVLKKKQCE